MFIKCISSDLIAQIEILEKRKQKNLINYDKCLHSHYIPGN